MVSQSPENRLFTGWFSHRLPLLSGGKCSHACPNQPCLKRASVCDGVLDCRDRGDELNCTRACELLPVGRRRRSSFL